MPFKIMSLTDAAVERITEIIEDSDTPVIGLRVGIKNSGCAGVAYTMDYVSEAVAGDDHVEDKGVNVWVDPKATMYLLGTVMDFEAGKLGSTFTFKNPNQTGACGCGESITLKPADLKALVEARAEA
ncbi:MULTISPECIES: iron-sulfur cluster assembly accessory protein [unclassified Devosia]|uniref:HesB/IscA family protein n=1 Tax=unclassified Devosia TaxID=196773 RepID=UPI00145D0AA7|nr:MULTISPECIES: iron-sulfur cluster assembly accessory protein [unclassified Devosia]MBJ6987045.1 iron-sulfur cluster assembly accessory protein [Devosia sp. MC521]MBJ7576581.1 iron-sulfur cluster assembly accessory protein [Devosia sp. MC532]MBK1795817.1 iron-sulfur cluster assembly accessory protein [Devosia sp. WQ 349K1]QMW64063.1 iron-sulfur cluster assembly accessory protein [Devosia sp. MC521]